MMGEFILLCTADCTTVLFVVCIFCIKTEVIAFCKKIQSAVMNNRGEN